MTISAPQSEENAQLLQRIQEGRFSPLLLKICHNCGVPQAAQWLRAVACQLVEDTGAFHLQDDALSWLMYDLQYMLYTFAYPTASFQRYLQEYPLILAQDSPFSTDGYTPEAIAQWMETRVKEGKLQQAGKMIGQRNCLVFTTQAMLDIVEHCKILSQKYPCE